MKRTTQQTKGTNDGDKAKNTDKYEITIWQSAAAHCLPFFPKSYKSSLLMILKGSQPN